VLLNNGAMATYSGATRGNIGEEARELGVSKMYGDYAKIAEGMGAVGLKVAKPSEMAPALHEAQTLNGKGRTVLIEVAAQEDCPRARY